MLFATTFQIIREEIQFRGHVGRFQVTCFAGDFVLADTQVHIRDGNVSHVVALIKEIEAQGRELDRHVGGVENGSIKLNGNARRSASNNVIVWRN